MSTRRSTSSEPSVERVVRPYEPTWLDKRFKKAFALLNAKQKKSCREQVVALILALTRCAHPLSDPELGRWRPSTYRVGGVRDDCQLVEYRLKGTFRVVAGFQPEVEELPGQRSQILLLVATLVHDHPRLRRLIAAHHRDWEFDEAGDQP